MSFDSFTFGVVSLVRPFISMLRDYSRAAQRSMARIFGGPGGSPLTLREALG
jgi:hypothetical protein